MKLTLKAQLDYQDGGAYDSGPQAVLIPFS